MTEYKSQTVTVNAPAQELFGKLTDLQGMFSKIPAQYAGNVTLENEVARLSYAGFNLSLRIAEKQPFSKVTFTDAEGSMFHFSLTFHLEPAEIITRTRLTIELAAELNFMMKSLVGSRIKEFLDKAAILISTGGILA